MNLLDALTSLLKTGANITGIQFETLKWRLSDEGKKYYSDKENKEFYKQLKKGNLNIVDAIRKEKQKRINDLKNQLLNIIILFSSLIIFGCTTIPKQQEAWDVNSLKESERTFRIKEQTIKVDGEWKAIKFDEGWYVVSEDHIKTFNENQDDLILALTTLKKERQQKNYILGGVGLISFLGLLWILARLTIGRRK